MAKCKACGGYCDNGCNNPDNGTGVEPEARVDDASVECDGTRGVCIRLAAALARERALRAEVDAAPQRWLEASGRWPLCDACGGVGRRAYPSSAGWRRCGGGQTMTDAVCDKCWGSGTTAWTGVDQRKMEAAFAALREAGEKMAEASVWFAETDVGCDAGFCQHFQRNSACSGCKDDDSRKALRAALAKWKEVRRGA